MSDLISRQAAIDEIKMLMEQSEDDEHDKTWNNAIRGSINAIKHHMPSAQPEQRWIPCSKMTPKEKGYYITTTIYKEVYCDFWNGINFDRQEKVTAWMPLPEPYKGKEE